MHNISIFVDFIDDLNHFLRIITIKGRLIGELTVAYMFPTNLKKYLTFKETPFGLLIKGCSHKNCIELTRLHGKHNLIPY